MKAFIYERYGLPETVLKLSECEKPEPKEDELLIKVHAAAVNDYDWSMVTGRPKSYRLLFGIWKPKHKTPGMEMSGTVEKTGSEVRKFKSGDQVFGDISSFGFGCFAEYLCVNEKAVVRKPENISFAEAAAIPHASLLALQSLRDTAKIRSGQKVLINGGGGGVGTFGLQLAKLHHCEVAGVDTGEKLRMMETMGYDRIIDYQKEDFTDAGIQYDIILDCKSSRSPFRIMKALKPKGKYVSIGGSTGSILSIVFWGIIISLVSSKKLSLLALKPNKGIEYIMELFAQNKLQCVLDGPYPMEVIPNRLQYFGEGKHHGKIVMKMNDLTNAAKLI